MAVYSPLRDRLLTSGGLLPVQFTVKTAEIWSCKIQLLYSGVCRKALIIQGNDDKKLVVVMASHKCVCT